MISALRSRNFRRLWLSQSISVVGDELVIVAVGLYVTRLTEKRATSGWSSPLTPYRWSR